MKYNQVTTNLKFKEMDIKGTMDIQSDLAMDKDFITHDQAKEYLLGKRGTPCRDQLEVLVQYTGRKLQPA